MFARVHLRALGFSLTLHLLKTQLSWQPISSPHHHSLRTPAEVNDSITMPFYFQRSTQVPLHGFSFPPFVPQYPFENLGGRSNHAAGVEQKWMQQRSHGDGISFPDQPYQSLPDFPQGHQTNGIYSIGHFTSYAPRGKRQLSSWTCFYY